MDWFKKFLDDEELMRDIVMSITFAIPIILLIVYWGFFDNIKIDGIKLSTITIVSLIFLYAGDSVRLNWRKRAQTDREKKDDIQDLIKDNEDIKFTEDDDDLGFEYVEMLNERTQLRADKKATKVKIDKLRNKKLKRMKKNKDIVKVTKDIKYLEQNPINATKITPFNYFDIISSASILDNKIYIKDGKSLKSNPVKVGRYKALFINLFRSVGIGSIVAGWMWSVDKKVAVWLFILLILTEATTAILQYYFTTKYMDTKHKQFLIDKLEKRKACRKYIDTKNDNTKKEKED